MRGRLKFNSDLARRYFIILIFSLLACLLVFSLLWYNLNSIRRASSDYEKFFESPRRGAEKIQYYLAQGIKDIQILSEESGTNWENTAEKVLNKNADVWDRESSPTGNWQSIHRKIPLYREAVFGHLYNGRCLIQKIRRSPREETRTDDKTPLFNFDNYCRALQEKPSKIYVSRLLGWFVPQHKQTPNKVTDPYDAIGGITQYDGIIRFGKISKSGESFVLLSLDYHPIYDSVIHLQSHPKTPVIFPRYERGDYSYLIDPDGWIIAHPKMWDMKGYDLKNGKLKKAWNNHGEQNLPIRYTKESTERIGFDVGEILHPKDLNKPIVRSFKSVSKLVRTRIFLPIPFSEGGYGERGYFAILVHGLDNKDFYSRIENFQQKVKQSIEKAKYFAVMILFLLVINMFLIVGYSWKRISLPILRLKKDMESVNLVGEESVSLKNYKDNPSEIHSLTKSVNDMLKKIAEQNETLNRGEILTELGKIASQVAHDIRSPLSSMQAALNYFKEVEISDPKATDFLNLLELSSRRLSQIADGLLKRNKGEASAKIIFSLHQVLDELVGEYQGQEQYQKVNFKKEYHTQAIEIFGERIKLQRAFGNLIKNSIEAMGGVGKMVTRTRLEGGTATVSIQDTGPGMTSETLQRVLAGGYTEGKQGGHGIGLTVVRETVAEFSGKLWALSYPKVGTTFFIEIPLPSKEILQGSPREEIAMEKFTLQVFEKEPVIVIDDDPGIREQWRLVLESNKRGVILCESYEDFERQKISTQISKTAVIDYHFDNSEMDGAEVVCKLQEKNFTNLYLCTAEYWKPSVQKLAKELNVQLCPKPLPKISVCHSEPKAKNPDVTQGGRAEKTGGYTVLVIDDDETIRLAWELMDRKLQIQKLHTFASLEAMEAARTATEGKSGGLDLSAIDIAFVDKNIVGSQFTGAQVVAYLKAKGVPKVILASGEDSGPLRQDPEFAQADFIVSEKIPQSFKAFFS